MKNIDLKNIIGSYCNDVLFKLNGKSCGVTSTVSDFIPTFQAWIGNETMETNDLDELMSSKFFDGNSLQELSQEISIEII